MAITSRKSWGAKAPRSQVFQTTWAKRTEFFVHHTAGPKTQSVKAIQDYHMSGNGWSDIGYNFLVNHKGKVYEGRDWLGVGAHAPDHNTSGIGVAFIGDDNPTTAAKASIRALYDEACGLAKRKLAMRCHADVYPTECPGAKLRAWVEDGMPVTAAKPKDEEIIVSGLPTLKPGAKGIHVKTIRWLLGARGFPPDDLWSFEFDNKLGLKVIEFKKAKSLPADMVWGDGAWKAALPMA